MVSEGLDATGVTAWAGSQLIARAGEGRGRLVLLTMLLVAALTAVISVNGAVAALLPVVGRDRRADGPGALAAADAARVRGARGVDAHADRHAGERDRGRLREGPDRHRVRVLRVRPRRDPAAPRVHRRGDRGRAEAPAGTEAQGAPRGPVAARADAGRPVRAGARRPAPARRRVRRARRRLAPGPRRRPAQPDLRPRRADDPAALVADRRGGVPGHGHRGRRHRRARDPAPGRGAGAGRGHAPAGRHAPAPGQLGVDRGARRRPARPGRGRARPHPPPGRAAGTGRRPRGRDPGRDDRAARDRDRPVGGGRAAGGGAARAQPA